METSTAAIKFEVRGIKSTGKQNKTKQTKLIQLMGHVEGQAGKIPLIWEVSTEMENGYSNINFTSCTILPKTGTEYK